MHVDADGQLHHVDWRFGAPIIARVLLAGILGHERLALLAELLKVVVRGVHRVVQTPDIYFLLIACHSFLSPVDKNIFNIGNKK